MVIDGRTFTKENQVRRILAWAASAKSAKRFIECICDDETARARLRYKQASAANRNFELYLRLKAEADRLELDRLVIDTGEEDLGIAVARAVAYVRGTRPPSEIPG